MKLDKNIVKMCRDQKLTISRLAQLSGVPVQTLHGWTSGRKAVQLEQLKKVAEALKVSVHELAFGEPDPFDPIGSEILREIFKGDVRVTIHKIERNKRGKRP